MNYYNTHYIGDLDGDDDIAATDVVLLRRYLAGYESSIIDLKCADYNADGKVTAKDLLGLRKFLAA